MRLFTVVEQETDRKTFSQVEWQFFATPLHPQKNTTYACLEKGECQDPRDSAENVDFANRTLPFYGKGSFSRRSADQGTSSSLTCLLLPRFDFHTCKMTILHPNQGVCAVSPHRCTEHRRKTHILAHKYQSDKKFTGTENVYLAWLFCHACEGRRTTCGNRLSPPTTWLPEIALRWSSLAASTFACWAPHQPLKHYAPSFLHLLISSSWISRKHTS